MKKITTEALVVAFRILRDAKLGDIDDLAKINIVRSVRAIKPVAVAFEDFRDDCRKSMRCKDHDDMEKKLIRWKQEEKEGMEITLSFDDRQRVGDYFTHYNNLVEKAIDEELKKVQEVDIKPITEETISKLADINEWQVWQILAVSEVFE